MPRLQQHSPLALVTLALLTACQQNTPSMPEPEARKQALVQTTVEAETLDFTSSGDSYGVWTDTAASAGKWLLYNANAVGDHQQLSVPVASSGTYNIKVIAKTYNNRAKASLTINGVQQGPEMDFYSASIGYRTYDLGNKTFTSAGNKPLRFNVTGKNTSSSGYALPIDAIVLTRNNSTYVLRPDQPQQTILGLGVEIQNDSIASGNSGIPTAVSAIPHDLVPAERTRLYSEMLQGFRYARVAMGLYVRGMTPDKKNFQSRYCYQAGQTTAVPISSTTSCVKDQLDDLAELVQQSGMEGVDLEYWSPAVAWKTDRDGNGIQDENDLIRGTINPTSAAFSSAADFYDQFSDAMLKDIQHLESRGLPVKMWSLQNEPGWVGSTAYPLQYPSAAYTEDQYYQSFKKAAAKIKAFDPSILIHANSFDGQYGLGSVQIRQDPAAAALIDAWSWHKIGTNPDEQVLDYSYYTGNTLGKPVFNVEYEYLDGATSEARMLQTAHSIMNWMAFENAPTWFWLHALKPTTNSESVGYGLGLWRPVSDTDYTRNSQIATGHFDYVKTNWHAVAGFVKHLPWNSVRITVEEPTVNLDARILAWKTPSGKYAFALTNDTGAAFTFKVEVAGNRSFTGHRYDKNVANAPLAVLSGSTLNVTVPNRSIEFWTEN